MLFVFKASLFGGVFPVLLVNASDTTSICCCRSETDSRGLQIVIQQKGMDHPEIVQPIILTILYLYLALFLSSVGPALFAMSRDVYFGMRVCLCFPLTRFLVLL